MSNAVMEHRERLEGARRARALERLEQQLAAKRPEAPPPVTPDMLQNRLNHRWSLPLDAYELARQLYYEQVASLTECARAVIAQGLSDTDDVTTVCDRLRQFFRRHGWPRHDTKLVFAVRDANYDGGMYRGRLCKSQTRQGQPCQHTAMADSDHCAQHDMRPESVAARKAHGQALWVTRHAELVELEPFRQFLDFQRRMLLIEARKRGEVVDAKEQGWSLLARKMGTNNTLLWRIGTGRHKTDRVQASTVSRYAVLLGSSFAEIYGYDPPPSAGERARTCPRCGGYKNAASKTCRTCYDRRRRKPRCRYVNRRGERCEIFTGHPSGYCHHCRRIVEYVPRPPLKGRVRSQVTPRMLALALAEYERNPSLQWCAAKLWAHGLRSTYSSQRTLCSGLVKRFARAGVRSGTDARLVSERLVRELLDAPRWPRRVEPIEGVALVPRAPFQAWLAERLRREGYPRRGAVAAVAARTGVDAERLGQWLHREQPFVTRSQVEPVLSAYGVGFEEVWR